MLSISPTQWVNNAFRHLKDGSKQETLKGLANDKIQDFKTAFYQCKSRALVDHPFLSYQSSFSKELLPFYKRFNLYALIPFVGINYIVYRLVHRYIFISKVQAIKIYKKVMASPNHSIEYTRNYYNVTQGYAYYGNTYVKFAGNFFSAKAIQLHRMYSGRLALLVSGAGSGLVFFQPKVIRPKDQRYTITLSTVPLENEREGDRYICPLTRTFLLTHTPVIRHRAYVYDPFAFIDSVLRGKVEVLDYERSAISAQVVRAYVSVAPQDFEKIAWGNITYQEGVTAALEVDGSIKPFALALLEKRENVEREL